MATNDAIWLKTSIINTTGEPIYCRIDNPRLDSVDIYIEPKNGPVYHYNAIGNSFPITNRAFYSNSLISNLPKDSSFTIYFRIVSSKRINFPLSIGTASTMLNFIFINTMLDSIYFGAALIILLYNFFIYLSLKNKASAYYFISTFSMVVFMTFWKGYQAFFTPFFKSFLFHYSNLFAVSTIFFLILFSVHFLEIKKLSVLLYRYYMLLAISLIGILLLTVTNNSEILSNVFFLIVMLSLISMVVGSIYAVIKKIIIARLYLLGFFINVICTVIFILPLAGIKSYSPFYSH
ncbi:MAG: serine phosphatase RsbU, regulator of sigma subunit, partial [Chitinophagaceae bacterium]|nr:serine phosphatase RsbU, regulator of sigma subunit [Chitinophagaceae bacterium]